MDRLHFGRKQRTIFAWSVIWTTPSNFFGNSFWGSSISSLENEKIWGKSSYQKYGFLMENEYITSSFDTVASFFLATSREWEGVTGRNRKAHPTTAMCLHQAHMTQNWPYHFWDTTKYHPWCPSSDNITSRQLGHMYICHCMWEGFHCFLW